MGRQRQVVTVIRICNCMKLYLCICEYILFSIDVFIKTDRLKGYRDSETRIEKDQ